MEGSLTVEVKDWMPQKTALIILTDCIDEAARTHKKEGEIIRSIQVRPTFESVPRELPSQIMRTVEAPPENVSLVVEYPDQQAAKAFNERVLPLVRKRLTVLQVSV